MNNLEENCFVGHKICIFSSSSFLILLKSWKQAYFLIDKINLKTFFILLSNYTGIFAVEYECCNIHALCSRGQELPGDDCAKHATGCCWSNIKSGFVVGIVKPSIILVTILPLQWTMGDALWIWEQNTSVEIFPWSDLPSSSDLGFRDFWSQRLHIHTEGALIIFSSWICLVSFWTYENFQLQGI